jgi:TatD DNase family protein
LLLDSHCHLDDDAFNADRDAVFERARQAGVSQMLLIGAGPQAEKLGAALELAVPRPGVYAAAGIHPHEAADATAAHWHQLQALAGRPKLVAIGEIGLDYFYDHSPRPAQQQVMIRQMELARAARLPIIIHCRDAWPDFRRLAAEHWRSSGLGGVLHCFTGERDDAFDLMDAGFLVSFAGNLTYKKSEGLRQVARQIPLERLLTETDSPYLAPVPHRGKRNEPAFVRQVTQLLAELHGLDEQAMGRVVTRNFTALFGVPTPAARLESQDANPLPPPF